MERGFVEGEGIAMMGKWAGVALSLLIWLAPALAQTDRRTKIDVEKYVIEGIVNPRTQTIAASAAVTFRPLDDTITTASFELNNALNISKVVDEAGQTIPTTRTQSDFSVRLSFLQPIAKGSSKTVTFFYEGRLSGTEESPVYGVKFASIKEDGAFLMYPARWFPVNDYLVDQFQTEINISVPAGFLPLVGFQPASVITETARPGVKLASGTASMLSAEMVAKPDPNAPAVTDTDLPSTDVTRVKISARNAPAAKVTAAKVTAAKVTATAAKAAPAKSTAAKPVSAKPAAPKVEAPKEPEPLIPVLATPAEFSRFQFTSASSAIHGSVAIVKSDLTPGKGESKGVTTTCYFKTQKDTCAAFVEEASNVLTYLTSFMGEPLSKSITLVETDSGAPNGYSNFGGLIFVAPNMIQAEPPKRLLANQLTRQWYGSVITPTTKNHLWLVNGMARYAEALYLENQGGAAALEAEVKDLFVDALTVNEAPLSQTSRYEDYSPEYWAMTASKGASILSMLRYVIGDKPMEQLLTKFTTENRGKQVNTAMFRKMAEEVSEKDLQNFFVQWVESTGAPEFKIEYTVFRAEKQFRILGKISQDLDTFRMPVELLIETEGNPERKMVEVVGTSSEFFVDSFGKPKRVVLDPDGKLLRFSPKMRVAVAIRRGEQLVDVGELNDALKEYQRALDVQRSSSLAHYRIAEVFFLQGNRQSAANEFREALNGDLDPKWVEVWSHINLGKIFDITGQRERAVTEYNLAVRTKDNTQGAQLEAGKYLKEPYKQAATE
jgi:tetratricopeptide (TPR) repeat protein